MSLKGERHHLAAVELQDLVQLAAVEEARLPLLGFAAGPGWLPTAGPLERNDLAHRPCFGFPPRSWRGRRYGPLAGVIILT